MAVTSSKKNYDEELDENVRDFQKLGAEVHNPAIFQTIDDKKLDSNQERDVPAKAFYRASIDQLTVLNPTFDPVDDDFDWPLSCVTAHELNHQYQSNLLSDIPDSDHRDKAEKLASNTDEALEIINGIYQFSNDEEVLSKMKNEVEIPIEISAALEIKPDEVREVYEETRKDIEDIEDQRSVDRRVNEYKRELYGECATDQVYEWLEPIRDRREDFLEIRNDPGLEAYSCLVGGIYADIADEDFHDRTIKRIEEHPKYNRKVETIDMFDELFNEYQDKSQRGATREECLEDLFTEQREYFSNM